MIITVKSYHRYIEGYVHSVGFLYGLTPREGMVATVMVKKYLKFEKLREQMKFQKTKDEFNAFEMVKQKDAVSEMINELDMDITVFRTYVKRIRDKGFIKRGMINKDFIPNPVESKITFKYDRAFEETK